MPDKNVLLILNRAFVDERFRAQLLADLDGTVAGLGLSLSAEARAELKQALDEGHDFATGLDQRVSQSGFALNPASLIRQKGTAQSHTSDYNAQNQIIVRAMKGGNRKTVLSPIKDNVIPVTESESIDYSELDIEVESD